jgi:drug/metabolite transporter superfamily protein YnfA
VHYWQRLIALFLTMGVTTIVGVVIFFRPIADADTASTAWSAPIALAVYAGLSVLLFDWAAQRLRNSFAAAFVIAAAQFIFIVDLLARGERGVLTAAAGTLLLVITWSSVAFVHSRLARRLHGEI